jgi:hypothetical protein
MVDEAQRQGPPFGSAAMEKRAGYRTRAQTNDVAGYDGKLSSQLRQSSGTVSRVGPGGASNYDYRSPDDRPASKPERR